MCALCSTEDTRVISGMMVQARPSGNEIVMRVQLETQTTRWATNLFFSHVDPDDAPMRTD